MMDRVARLAEHCKSLVGLDETWEQPAVFFTAHETPDGSVYLRDIGLPVELLQGLVSHPLHLVRMLPGALAVNQAVVADQTEPGFFGWVFRSHAWAVDRNTKAEARRDRHKSLAKDPGRKLAVAFNGATLDGSMFLALNVREDDHVSVTVHRPNAFGQYVNTLGVEEQLPFVSLLAACKVMEEIGAVK